jgi:fatty-acyl-CoA synthase
MSSLLNSLPTLGTQTIRALSRYPERIAFAWDGGGITYRAALDLAGRIQAEFHSRKIGRGERVALLTSNRAETWMAGVAAQLNGASITFLHPLGSLDDHLSQLADSAAETLVVDTEVFGTRGGEIASRATLRNLLTIGDAEYGTDLLAAALAAPASEPRDLATSDDEAALNYTGGTTGRSKGAVRSHREYGAFATAILADFELPDTPRYLVVAPMSHVAGTKILPVWFKGGTVHLQKGFDPDTVLRTIAREKINFTLFVPTMIYILLDSPTLSSTNHSSLDLVLYGASPMSPTRLVEAIERIGPVFAQLYGQTECYPISVLRKSDHDAARPELFESCGQPISICDGRILDDNDTEVKVGEAGEICVRAPHVMKEYWKQPEVTAETLKSGWLHTGDIARRDERGYMFILDRKKDMIVSGGFNIFPREVEDVLSSHADVAMVAVLGVPDPKWGEAVTAVVVLRPGAKADPRALIELVKSKKGSTHAPKAVEFVESLPLTAVGKVDKKELRAKYWAGRTRMVG